MFYGLIDQFNGRIKGNSLRIFSIIILLVFFPAAVLGIDMRPETIRVAVLKGVENLTLEGSGILLMDGNGQPLRLDTPIQVKRTRDGIAVNNRKVGGLKATAPASLLVNGKGYRGVLEILPADRGLLVVDELPLEDYLVGLINCEISSQWPIEAVKAQAVIARSYAVYQKAARRNALYHLESSVMDQVYEGSDIEDSRAIRGVRETAGEVLTYAGAVIQAFYHSSCGGHTEAAENVWGNAVPYLTGVDCKYCLPAPSVRWEQTIPLKKLESLLKNAGFQAAGLREIRPGRRNRSGRLQDLVIVSAKGRLIASAVNFRKAVGYSTIKSTNFEIRGQADEITFTGIGYGHGVGLCQWGAKQRAGDGFDYREILSYYYPGTRLEKIPAN
ncbi:SpoIID/LytB domain-containing protein [Geotalea sp. SG265]|uniref:SpoIID/LytB domain-containing protein n=1 Tax=Geotalea sp. SG265 TaxID=2922867 RepID=UPI001FAEE894|nr:SpoIID/LytB domain-containing protein [Geotalea sp. SG265]